jgi:hypothetical protein
MHEAQSQDRDCRRRAPAYGSEGSVGLFNPEGRPSRREEREAARRRLDDAVDDYIRRAAAAAQAGDIGREEKTLAAGFRWAQTSSAAVSRQLAARVSQEVGAGRLRSPYLGFAGDLQFYKDRILAPEGVRLMDEHVRATVESGGSIQRTQRPTLTRMALGSILPGTALIPGLAMPKTTVHDDRELYFVIEHPEWARLMKLDPSLGEQARAVAVAINQAANELKAKRVAAEAAQVAEPAVLAAAPAADSAADTVAQLAQLAQLHGAGALSDEEFAQAKARVLAA